MSRREEVTHRLLAVGTKTLVRDHWKRRKRRGRRGGGGEVASRLLTFKKEKKKKMKCREAGEEERRRREIYKLLALGTGTGIPIVLPLPNVKCKDHLFFNHNQVYFTPAFSLLCPVHLLPENTNIFCCRIL